MVAVILALAALVPAGISLSNTDQTKRLLAIQSMIEQGDLASAGASADAALKQHPTDGGLWNLRGVVHARRGELSEARSDFENAVRFSPGLEAGWQNLGRACQLVASKDVSIRTRAVEAWRRVLLLDGGNAEAHASLAVLDQQAGSFEESLRELRAAGPGVAADTRMRLLKCLDLAAAGHLEDALTLATKLAGSSEFTEADLEGLETALDEERAAPAVVPLLASLAERNAASLPTLERLAVAYERVKRPADARRVLERAAAMDPQNPVHLVELGRLADLAQDYEGEIGYLAHARDLTPNDAKVHYLYGLAAEKLNLPIEARRSLEKAVALDPGNPAYNYALGSVILMTRDAASAAAYLEKFVAAKPQDPYGRYLLGIAEFSSGDYDRAKDNLTRVSHAGAVAPHALCYLGRIADIEGDFVTAKHLLSQSISLSPSLAESHTELARVFFANKDAEDGKKELAEALRLDPNNFRANSDLLAFYERTHDPRAQKQQELLKNLDEERSRRAELMLRTIEVVR